MSIYNRVLIHRPRWPLPGRRVYRVHPVGENHPLLVRLGTSDWYALEEIFLHDEYAEVLKNLSGRDVKTILDLGANVGMSVRLWQSAYPGARVVAVEPDAGNVTILRRNIEMGRAEVPVEVVQACVAGSPRKVKLDRSRGEYAYRMSDAESPDDREIDALTVPQLLERGKLDGPIDLLKCDIEGAEAEVFADCAAWIGKIRNIVIEIHPPYTTERLLHDLQRGGSNLVVRDGRNKGGMDVLFLSASA